ncbi:MAG: Cell shape-determining protein RodA [candidate division TM6 bacterium GW2011_GWE2_41_16]|nr:MAG: Cell shape-determining protein RodA [candidate division TM6 bacterium GW2011_GWE2_41_16]
MVKLDRRYFAQFDWVSFILVLLISLVGLATVFSATTSALCARSVHFDKHVWGILAGIVIYLFFCAQDYHKLERWGYFAFYVLVIILIITLIKGSIGIWGAQRWISIAGIRFQPSEFAKLLLPPFFTYLIATEKRRPFKLHTFLFFLGILSFVCVLILKQPDLGTAIIIFLEGLILLWAADFPRKYFITLFIIMGLCAPAGWFMLKPYQKNRIIVYMGGGDLHKERYHIEQSKIAIGSGGICGKGYLKGTQNHLCFLPARRTDFIFSVFAEEFGLIGCFLLIILFLLLFIRSYTFLPDIIDPHAQLLAFGLITPVALSTFINISMGLGLAPVVGIPLPFMTCGLSHNLITFAALGWAHGILARRFSMLAP